MSENEVCWCGHIKAKHTIDYELCCDEHSDVEYPICLTCAEDDMDEYGWDHEFEQDNLRYLENLEQKQSEKSS